MTSDPIMVLGIFTVDLTICPNGARPTSTPLTCVAQIEHRGSAALSLNAITPDSIQLTGTIPVKLRDLPIGTIERRPDRRRRWAIPRASRAPTRAAGSDAEFGNFPVTIDLPLVAETIAPRTGYMKIDAKNAVVNVGLQQSDIQLCSSCASAISGLCNTVLGFITGVVFTPLQQQLNAQVQSQLATQLCTKANSALSPACPLGSHADTADGGAPPLSPDGGLPAVEPNCVYDASPTTCVPTELGFEGNMNLGALFASISPGTSGAVDFALAANGNMIPAPGAAADSNGNTPNGITLGMLGGGLPAPQSDCVPVAPNPAPTNLVVPNQMLTDSVTGYGSDAGPDIGVALDGQFLNYFLGSAYNSGLLCLGVSTEKYQQLNTGLVSFLIPSMKTLTFEQKAAAIAISTRPQKPPQLTIGGGTNLTSDPLLSILLPSFAIDFYIWSEDRYIRAFTFTADVTIPVNLQTGTSGANPSGGLLPTIGTLTIANGVVTNNVLITDDPASIASALSGVLGSIVGQLLGSAIPPINLASALSSLGLTFKIPTGGIQKITQGSESYLAIFGDLGLPTQGGQIAQIDTSATLLGKTVHPEAMTLKTYDPALMPSLQVHFASPADDGRAPVEYSWQIDQGTFSPWSPARDATIRDAMLWMQAKHTLQVTSRIAGVPLSQDTSPASVPFTIDVLPPQVSVRSRTARIQRRGAGHREPGERARRPNARDGQERQGRRVERVAAARADPSVDRLARRRSTCRCATRRGTSAA